MKKMTKVFGIIVVLAVIFSMFSTISASAANAPGAIYYFDEAVNASWVQENAGIDQAFQFYAPTSSTYNKCYNISWASRFGGFAFKGVDLNLKISSTKNRFVVLNLRPDETAVLNSFDKLGIYLQVDGGAVASLVSQSPAAAGTYGQAFAVLHDANPQAYTKVIIDLMWPFETEKTLNMLRFDMFSSDKAHSAAGADAADAYNCGCVHFKYIAFFDTLEDAQAFEYPAPATPTPEPATPTPAPTEVPTAAPTDVPATDAPATDAPATDAPATDAPATDAPQTGDSTALLILAAVIAVALAAFVVIKHRVHD